jgi:butyrate kinase
MKKNKVFRMLVINPGSTSTKIAVFDNEKILWEKNLAHSSVELEQFGNVWEQYDFRKKTILRELEKKGFRLDEFAAVVGRGGLLPSVESGTYRVNNAMIDDLRAARRGQHASNLGPILAYGIAWDLKIEAFTVDPVSVDEFEPLARYSGVPAIPRESLLHALNIRAVARKYSEQVKKPLDSMNLIVTHMGGGITCCAMRRGRMIEVNNGITEGPFTPERAGNLPTLPLVEMCFSGVYTKAQIKEKLVGKGGLVAYLGTNSAKTVESMIASGNTRAAEVYEAMAYQIAQEVGGRATVLKGDVDAVILTGGMAHSKTLTDWIVDRVKFIAPVVLIPGEDELEALALGALRVLRGDESAKLYGDRKKTIGVIIWESLTEYEEVVQELEHVLKESGYKFRVPDENLEIVYRNCNEQDANCRTIINDFVDLGVDLIYSIGTPIISTVKKMLLGKSTPVVFAAAFDPVMTGLVHEYRGRENNTTGTYYRVSLAEQLDRGLNRVLPSFGRMGLIHTTGEIHSDLQLDEALKVAGEKGFELFPFDVQNAEDMPRAVTYFEENAVDVVYLLADTLMPALSRKALQTVTHRFPTLCALRTTVQKGGLVAFCANYRSLCHQSAQIAIRVMAGEKPQNIDFAGPDEHELIVNLDTARKLGIEIGDDVKHGASELIQ